jgi:hypothetical protein
MSRRVAAVASAALAVFVCVGGASASLGVTSSVAASLEVSASRGVVGFGYDQSPDVAAPSRIAVHVPDEFPFTPSANGAPIGSIVGTAVFDIAADPRQPLPGVLTIADPAGFAPEGKALHGVVGARCYLGGDCSRCGRRNLDTDLCRRADVHDLPRCGTRSTDVGPPASRITSAPRRPHGAGSLAPAVKHRPQGRATYLPGDLSASSLS